MQTTRATGFEPASTVADHTTAMGRLLLITLLLLTFVGGSRAQETLTVCDGTTTNCFIPVYGLYVDTPGTTSEFIIPAGTEGMSDMAGGTISKVTFYLSEIPGTWGSPVIQLYLAEVDGTTLSSLYGPSDFTVVKTMVWSNQQSSIEVVFDEPYTYEGGNLLIGTYVQTKGVYKTTYFYGVSGVSGCSRYNSGSGPGTSQNFLPKTTFEYTPADDDMCEKPATLVADNVTSNSATLTWTGGSGVYNIELNGTIIEESYEGYTYNLTNLNPTTNYTAKVQSVCDGSKPTSNWKIVKFTTPCDTYDIPYTYGFEDAAPFECWTVISGNITRMNDTSNTGSYRLDFRGTTSNMIALPQFNEATNNLRVEFYTRPESTGGNSGKFAIGYMTDINDASTFVAVETYNSTEMTTTYVKKTVDFVNVPANANIAMRQFDCATNYYWYVDDVTVKEIPSCLAPTGLAANASTTSAELSWTANSGETAWTLYWKKTTDENYTEVANATNPYTLNGLDASSKYQYYVVANCSADDASDASEVFTFATACDVIAALGYSENFDSYTAGNNVLPNCWNYINTTTYSTYAAYPRVYANTSYSTYANSAPNCLYLYSSAYYSGGTTTYDPQPQYAILPEMTGLAGLQVTLMARGYSATSTFKIGTMSDPTDASTFQLIAEQALTTSYNEYSFIVNQEGNYLAIMIDAANESRTINGVYIDDISIDNVPTCLKPSSPMLETPSSRTAHTTTLKWTNGEEGQSAWQIAYSTSNTFAPAADFTPGENEWLVDADANPYTLNGLQANTTYYAYVRANCGAEDGVSAWSRTKATFTTTAANVAPTGLAVDASTITSNSATLTWTGVATNDLHESYEVYLSTEATMPEELVAERLITGITATSYEFTGLEVETPYYVWVRDNCGSDGLSAWSSVSFTTASICPTPDGLAESNVTNNSATITWNTHGLTAFNLRYGIDGENWTFKENVNTPYTLDHLSTSTAYQVQVQAACADAETWSAVLRFNTACGAISDLPWSENFDAYTGSTGSTVPTDYPNDELPNCWRFLNRSNTSSSYPQVFISSNSGYPVSGNCLFFKSSSSTPLYAVLPAFEENIAGLQLTFTYRNAGTSTSNGTLYVGYMTNPADATTFTTVLTCEKTTTLTEKEVLFTDAPAGSYIAFMYQGGSYNNYYMSIDNVKVDVIQTCKKPTDLVFVSATTATATLSWTNGAAETAWQICLDGNEENLIMANSNPFTVEGLTSSTAYTAKVRAYCSADDQSDWSNEVSFATECDAIVVNESWSEDFEDGDMPACWRKYGNGTWTVGTGDYNASTGAHTGTYNAKITHNMDGCVTKLITPVLDITSLANPTLTFWYINRAWAGDIDGFAVYYRTASDAAWTLIEATEEAHSTWTEATYMLPNPSATYQIAFEMTDGYGYGVGIDDIIIEGSSFKVYDTANNSMEIGKRNGKTFDVTLSGRTLLKNGYWNTLCLPFNLQDLSDTPLAGATLKELDVDNTWSLDGDQWTIDASGEYQTALTDDGTLYLFFIDANNGISAGVPYIIMWPEGDNIVDPVFSGVTIANDALTEVSFQGGKFVGTYGYTQFDTDNKSILLLGAQNTLYWPKSGASIGAFRAYFDLGSNGDAVREFRLNFGGEGSTQGIVSLTTNPAPKGIVYTLDGRKLDKMPTRKGLYIENGHKVVIK